MIFNNGWIQFSEMFIHCRKQCYTRKSNLPILKDFLYQNNHYEYVDRLKDIMKRFSNYTLDAQHVFRYTLEGERLMQRYFNELLLDVNHRFPREEFVDIQDMVGRYKISNYGRVMSTVNVKNPIIMSGSIKHGVVYLLGLGKFKTVKYTVRELVVRHFGWEKT